MWLKIDLWVSLVSVGCWKSVSESLWTQHSENSKDICASRAWMTHMYRVFQKAHWICKLFEVAILIRLSDSKSFESGINSVCICLLKSAMPSLWDATSIYWLAKSFSNCSTTFSKVSGLHCSSKKYTVQDTTEIFLPPESNRYSPDRTGVPIWYLYYFYDIFWIYGKGREKDHSNPAFDPWEGSLLEKKAIICKSCVHCTRTHYEYNK